MPVFDISQSSYRALVKAAHRRGMSVDRFIQRRFARENYAPDASGASHESEAAPAERMPVAARAHKERPVSNAGEERKAARPGFGTAESSFKDLWERIEQNAGREVSTKRGQSFTYEVEAGYLTVHESGTRVPRSQFKKALAQWPATGPATMRGVYAASVVWAVLADCMAPGVRDELWHPRELRGARQGR